MKTFNKQIKITVELDQIANMLLASMDSENKHREMIVESIVGRIDANNDQAGMSLLYNSLCGFTNEINFKVDEFVACSESAYGYWDGNSETYASIGECKIIEVNIYAKDKLRVEYTVPNKEGVVQTKRMWVSHTNCTKIVNQGLIDLRKSIETTIDTEVEGS